MNHYETLGVEKTASQEEIKAAFRKIAFENHPDRTNGDQEKTELFKKANEAYAVLSDQEKRKEYDLSDQKERIMEDFFRKGPGKPGAMHEDILREMFKDMTGASYTQDFNQQTRPQEISFEQKISLKDVIHGLQTKRKIGVKYTCGTCAGLRVNTQKKVGSCQACNGIGSVEKNINHPIFGARSVRAICESCRGMKIQYENCETCLGQGFETIEQEVQLNIPCGFMGGMVQLTARHPTNENKITKILAGIKVEVPEDCSLDSSQNIIKNIEVKYSDMLLGMTSFEVELPEGSKVKLKIPPGTNEASKLRLAGKGLPVGINSNVRTDLLVKLTPLYPKELTPEQRELLEKLQTTGL